MNINSVLLVFLILALLALSGLFFKQNMTYKLTNRKLMLQNDSLISVTMELNRQLHDIRRDSQKQDTSFAGLSK